MTTEPVSNSDVFLWALYELGGGEDFLDVEDVFWRAFELAPKRLSWRTREDLPDLKKCSKALRDAEGRDPKLLLKKGAETRKLTVEGQRWIEENFDRLADALGADRIVQATKARRPTRLVAAAMQSHAYRTWAESAELPEERWRVAEMLRCTPDSSRAVFSQRLEDLRAAANAAGRHDVLKFFDSLLDQRRDWF